MTEAKPMSVSEAGRKGGQNSRKNLPPDKVRALAIKAGKASGKARKAKKSH